jgi:hypothetical protein
MDILASNLKLFGDSCSHCCLVSLFKLMSHEVGALLAIQYVDLTREKCRPIFDCCTCTCRENHLVEIRRRLSLAGEMLTEPRS